MEQRELVKVDLHAMGRRTGGTLNAGQTLKADRYGQISKRSEEVIMTVIYHRALQNAAFDKLVKFPFSAAVIVPPSHPLLSGRKQLRSTTVRSRQKWMADI